MSRLEIPAEFQAERARQVNVEGYSPEHDDAHDNGDLLAVARMYWQLTIGVALPMRSVRYQDDEGEFVEASEPIGFPWDPWWWKPKSALRNLERAGALCLAEIDRLKRKGAKTEHVEDQLDLIAQAYLGLRSAG